MDITAFRLRDVQMFLMLTQMAEAEGITDLPTLRARLHGQVEIMARASRVVNREVSRRQSAHQSTPCPECGAPLVPTRHEGLQILACRQCRWSKVVA